MSIDPISATGLTSLAGIDPAALSSAARPGIFDAMVEAIGNVNTSMIESQKSLQSLALGQTDNLNQVMMDVEKARLAFEVVLQLRNRALEAYQELMRMQI